MPLWKRILADRRVQKAIVVLAAAVIRGMKRRF